MKIYLAHSSKIDYQNELYNPIKNCDISKKHEVIYLYEQTKNPGSTLDLIKSCDLVIAEVSYPSMGEGIELGWAYDAGVPIICIHKPNMLASKFLSVISNHILEYDTSATMTSQLTTAIEDMDIQ